LSGTGVADQSRFRASQSAFRIIAETRYGMVDSGRHPTDGGHQDGPGPADQLGQEDDEGPWRNANRSHLARGRFPRRVGPSAAGSGG